MRDLFIKVAQSLESGGSFFLGSRNRLFNAFSQNDFTKKERSVGSLGRLQKESLLFLTSAASDLYVSLLNMEDIARFGEIHPHAKNINVTTGHQYTLAELIKALAEVDLQTKEIHGIHYHPFLGSHNSLALTNMHKFIPNFIFNSERTNTSLVPLSSSFILHVSK